MNKQSRYKHLNEAERQLLYFIVLMIIFDSASISGNVFNFNEEVFRNVWKGKIEIKDIDGKKIFLFSKKDIVNLLNEREVPSEFIDRVWNLPNIDEEEFKLIISEERDEIFKPITDLIGEMDQVMHDLSIEKLLINDQEANEKFENKFLKNIPCIINSWCLFSNSDEVFDSLKRQTDIFHSIPLIYYYSILKLFHFNGGDVDFKLVQILSDWLSDSSINRITVGLSDLDFMPFVFSAFLNGTEVNILDWTKTDEEKYVLYLFKVVVDVLNKISPKTNSLTFNGSLNNERAAFVGNAKSLSKTAVEFYKYNRAVILTEDVDLPQINLLPLKEKSLFLNRVYNVLKLNGKNKYFFFSQGKECRGLSYTDFSSDNTDITLDSNYSSGQYFFIKNLINRVGFSAYRIDKNSLFDENYQTDISSDLFKEITSSCNESLNSIFKTIYYEKPTMPTVLGSLEDLTTVIRGQVLSTGESNDIAFELNPGDISDSGFIANVEKIITHADHGKNEKYRIKKGDILVGVKGLVGRVGFMDREVDNLYAGQAIAIVRVKKDCDFPPEFFFSILKSVFSNRYDRTQYLSKNSKTIIMSNFRCMPIPFPDRPHQDYVERVKQLFNACKFVLNMSKSIANPATQSDLNLVIAENPKFLEKIRTVLTAKM